MNTEIQIFENPEFGQIRTMTDENGEPWFVGKDVAEMLGYKYPSKALCDRVDNEDKTSLLIQLSGSNYKAKTTFINESGLYSLILSSKLPKAREFKHWVTSVVLPQIRQTGGYLPLSDGDTRESILRKALSIYDATVQIKDDIIHTLLPKAQYAEQVLLSPTCYTMTQVAKSLSMTVLELTHELLLRRIIYRQSGTYMLYAPFLKQGYEAYRTKLGENIFGATASTDTYLVWTEKGREFVRRCLS